MVINRCEVSLVHIIETDVLDTHYYRKLMSDGFKSPAVNRESTILYCMSTIDESEHSAVDSIKMCCLKMAL
jgi:hypothetical protein